MIDAPLVEIADKENVTLSFSPSFAPGEIFLRLVLAPSEIFLCSVLAPGKIFLYPSLSPSFAPSEIFHCPSFSPSFTPCEISPRPVLAHSEIFFRPALSLIFASGEIFLRPVLAHPCKNLSLLRPCPRRNISLPLSFTEFLPAPSPRVSTPPRRNLSVSSPPSRNLCPRTSRDRFYSSNEDQKKRGGPITCADVSWLRGIIITIINIIIFIISLFKKKSAHVVCATYSQPSFLL